MVGSFSLMILQISLLYNNNRSFVLVKANDEDQPFQLNQEAIKDWKQGDESTSNVLIHETTIPSEDRTDNEITNKNYPKKKMNLSSRLLSSLSTIHDENATYLDIFGEWSKEYIIHQFIPPTDAKCDWNWSHLRCEPFCDCDYVYQFGDYHLGRSCRLRQLVESDEEHSDTLPKMDMPSSIQKTCHLPPNTRTYKLIRGFCNIVTTSWKKINIPKRVDHLKDRVCSSLDMSLLQQRTSTETNGNQQYQNQSEEDEGHAEYTEFGFLEKPVRALRRSLLCST